MTILLPNAALKIPGCGCCCECSVALDFEVADVGAEYAQIPADQPLLELLTDDCNGETHAAPKLVSGPYDKLVTVTIQAAPQIWSGRYQTWAGFRRWRIVDMFADPLRYALERTTTVLTAATVPCGVTATAIYEVQLYDYEFEFLFRLNGSAGYLTPPVFMYPEGVLINEHVGCGAQIVTLDFNEPPGTYSCVSRLPSRTPRKVGFHWPSNGGPAWIGLSVHGSTNQRYLWSNRDAYGNETGRIYLKCVCAYPGTPVDLHPKTLWSGRMGCAYPPPLCSDNWPMLGTCFVPGPLGGPIDGSFECACMEGCTYGVAGAMLCGDGVSEAECQAWLWSGWRYGDCI